MSRALSFLLACVFFSTASAPVAAADISVHKHGVLIQGTIQKGDYARIIQFVRHPDNYTRFTRSVFLDSPGGDVLEAVKIANLLDKSYAATHVASGARCYSACFILWMAGVTRNVSSGATLGVHRVSVMSGDATSGEAVEALARVSRNVESYMQQLGTPRAILDKMNTTAAADMFVISPRWLAEQQLLMALSYRLGFIDAAQSNCGPEPFAEAMKRSILSTEEENRWISGARRWLHCADGVRASQRGAGVTVAALIGDWAQEP
ncbi:MAG: hypothetical protein Q7T70_16080 [Polaromonas sp.]|nr:hypothetical protein [Polaromonas sp.]